MKSDYPQGFIACDANVNIAPPLDEASVLKVFSGLRRTLASHGLTHFQHEQEEKVCRLNNGEGVTVKDERIVKLTKGSQLRVLWGANTPLQTGVEICRLSADELLRNLDLIQIENFNCEVHIDVESKGSAYDRIAALAYSENTVGAFYSAMRNLGSGFHIGDNDLHVLFHVGESKTGAIRIRGKTTQKEMFTGEYDNDPVRFFFGMQNSRIGDGQDEFLASLCAHIQQVHELVTTIFMPTVVEKFRIQQPPA